MRWFVVGSCIDLDLRLQLLGETISCMSLSLFRTAFVGALLCVSPQARSQVVESSFALPVTVTDPYGRVVSQDVQITVFRDPAKARSPFLVLNHGRAVAPQDRAKLGRARYSENSRYFVSLGYAVFVPTRIGYGVSGGPDVEDSGALCRNKNYPPAYEAGAKQTMDLTSHVKGLPYVDPSKGLVVGQSFGGTIAISIAAKNIPGVLATVNFAGGGGGNPETQPGRPCRPDLLGELFASYGAAAKQPTLWLYSENDLFMGKDAPKEWYNLFRKAGGKGDFVQLPAFGKDGHGSFSSNPSAWKPAFEAFLKSL
ncbi:MAG: dienelactone hydrolase family protein [Elsteraceae bacterium]